MSTMPTQAEVQEAHLQKVVLQAYADGATITKICNLTKLSEGRVEGIIRAGYREHIAANRELVEKILLRTNNLITRAYNHFFEVVEKPCPFCVGGIDSRGHGCATCRGTGRGSPAAEQDEAVKSALRTVQRETRYLGQVWALNTRHERKAAERAKLREEQRRSREEDANAAAESEEELFSRIGQLEKLLDDALAGRPTEHPELAELLRERVLSGARATLEKTGHLVLAEAEIPEDWQFRRAGVSPPVRTAAGEEANAGIDRPQADEQLADEGNAQTPASYHGSSQGEYTPPDDFTPPDASP